MPSRQQQQAAAYLVNAVSAERVERVGALLLSGSNPNIPMEDGVYPLGLATFRGRLDLVLLLLRHGAKVDTRGPGGPTALHTACVGDHFAIVQELIAAGADPNQRDEGGKGPLHWLARRGSVKILKHLIHAGSKMDVRDPDGFTPLHYAADAGNLPILHELVRAGSSHAWLSNTRQTPLALACMRGDPGCVKYLLDKCKTDPGAADDVGYTPFAIAAQHGHFEAVEMLLKFGVSQLGPNAYRDALSGVAMAGDVRMVRALVRAEGGVHVQGALTSKKMTPLHYTAGYCHPLATSVLLEAGGDEKAANVEGETPEDVIDTMRSEHVQHGAGRRRVRRMLAQGPAYRARSWRWPNMPASSSLLFTAGSAKDEAESANHATEPMTAEAGAGVVEGATDSAEMTAEDFDVAFEVAMAIAAESVGAGKVGLTVYRRPATSSGGSAADRRTAVVASLVRYSGKK